MTLRLRVTASLLLIGAVLMGISFFGIYRDLFLSVETWALLFVVGFIIVYIAVESRSFSK
jgi:hypothetical protein